jgi:hypothetical protein
MVAMGELSKDLQNRLALCSYPVSPFPQALKNRVTGNGNAILKLLLNGIVIRQITLPM